MFKLIKILVFTAIVAAATLYVADMQWKGKTVREHFKDAYKNGLFAEGYKDLKTWTGDVLHTAKKVSVDGVTDKDKKELENVIKNELKDNVMKMKEDAEKK